MFVLLQTQRLRHFYPIPPSRRSLLPGRLAGLKAALVEHPGQERGFLEPVTGSDHCSCLYTRWKDGYCRVSKWDVFFL